MTAKTSSYFVKGLTLQEWRYRHTIITVCRHKTRSSIPFITTGGCRGPCMSGAGVGAP
jgi:hypothetical protein